MSEQPHQDDEAPFPPALRAQLKSLYAPPVPFPAGRDAAILARARGQRRAWRWWAAGAVAATIAIAAGSAWLVREPGGPGAQLAYAPTGDIRDAFYLERQLKAHAAVGTTWDQNHDGKVDENDVRTLAQAAVRIAPREEAR